MKNLIILTTTYHNEKRPEYIERCISVFCRVPEIYWILVEDGSSPDPQITQMIQKSKIPYCYLAKGPTCDKGNSQKNFGLSYIHDHQLTGIVYLADDDNYWDIRLFQEIRKTKKVSVFPIGNLGPNGIERPLVRNSRIVGWDAGWESRMYPVDWGAIAFDANLLQSIDPPLLRGYGKTEDEHANDYGYLKYRMETENEFLKKLITHRDELEPLCEECTQCYVWHNQPLGEAPWVTHLKFKMKKTIKLIRNFINRKRP